MVTSMPGCAGSRSSATPTASGEKPSAGMGSAEPSWLRCPIFRSVTVTSPVAVAPLRVTMMTSRCPEMGICGRVWRCSDVPDAAVKMATGKPMGRRRSPGMGVPGAPRRMRAAHQSATAARPSAAPDSAEIVVVVALQIGFVVALHLVESVVENTSEILEVGHVSAPCVSGYRTGCVLGAATRLLAAAVPDGCPARTLTVHASCW
jgi:hypothetical protein